MTKRNKGVFTGAPVTYEITNKNGDTQIETFVPWKLIKRNIKREIISPVDTPVQSEVKITPKQEEDSPLLRALGLAYYWQRLLDEGKFKSLTEIAIAEDMNLSQVSRIARLAQLSPEIIEICLNQANTQLTLKNILHKKLSPNWQLQILPISTK